MFICCRPKNTLISFSCKPKDYSLFLIMICPNIRDWFAAESQEVVIMEISNTNDVFLHYFLSSYILKPGLLLQ